MKLVIAGTRTLNLCHETINGFILAFDLAPMEIVCGGCHGVDWSGSQWAAHSNVAIKMMLADWDKFGKAAGPIRNAKMADYGDALLLIWDGKSKGSANMKREMLALKKPVYEVILSVYNAETPFQ